MAKVHIVQVQATGQIALQNLVLRLGLAGLGTGAINAAIVAIP